MLAAGQVTCALIIGAEVISKQLDWNDRSTCIIFADGAGAAIVKQRIRISVCCILQGVWEMPPV